MATAVGSYMAKGCSKQDQLMSALAKHAHEIGRMQNPQYQDLTRCVEAALTIMRLSCEQYFTLISVFAAYLFFRQRLPLIARQVIWVNHRVSNAFKKVMLFVCNGMQRLHSVYPPALPCRLPPSPSPAA